MEVRIERGGGEVAVETEVFTLLFWLVRKQHTLFFIVSVSQFFLHIRFSCSIRIPQTLLVPDSVESYPRCPGQR